MKIAIIGAGNVGKALGLGWAKLGHEVYFGVREPNSAENDRLREEAGPQVKVRTAGEASAECEVIALTVPWNATAEVIKSLVDLRNKIVLDCTNPVKQWPALDHEGGKSGGEQVAEWARGARVVKIFNTTGFENMAKPQYAKGRLTMLYCGDDADAKRTAHRLAEELGFEAQDCGGIRQAYFLEVMASLWGTLAYSQKLGRRFGFRLVRDEEAR